MPIYQTNLWVCEACGHKVSTCADVSAYDDPVVTMPSADRWGFVTKDGKELFACPECIENDKP